MHHILWSAKTADYLVNPAGSYVMRLTSHPLPGPTRGVSVRRKLRIETTQTHQDEDTLGGWAGSPGGQIISLRCAGSAKNSACAGGREPQRPRQTRETMLGGEVSSRTGRYQDRRSSVSARIAAVRAGSPGPAAARGRDASMNARSTASSRLAAV